MDFAVSIINLCKVLRNEKREYILSKQLLRSGTSVGANVHEAINAQGKKDFIAKMYIALKESTETEYWIDLLNRTDYFSKEQYQGIKISCQEVKRILHSIVKTSKENNENEVN